MLIQISWQKKMSPPELACHSRRVVPLSSFGPQHPFTSKALLMYTLFSVYV